MAHYSLGIHSLINNSAHCNALFGPQMTFRNLTTKLYKWLLCFQVQRIVSYNYTFNYILKLKSMLLHWHCVCIPTYEASKYVTPLTL